MFHHEIKNFINHFFNEDFSSFSDAAIIKASIMWRVALAALALVSCTSAEQPRCEEITIPMCRGIGYNLTSFPNALDHDTQEEAGLEVSSLFARLKCYYTQ